MTNKPVQVPQDEDDVLLEHWQIVRRRAKWRVRLGSVSLSEAGTYPVVVTDEDDVGGWRVPGPEYDRDPERIEHQSRMIACTPDLIRIARQISDFATDSPDACPSELEPVIQRCAALLRFVYQLEDEQAETVAAE